MNAAENHGRTAFFRELSYGISAKRVARVDSDTDDVAGSDRRFIEMFQCFVTDNWIAKFGRSCSSKDEQPARRNHSRTERGIARVNKMDFQGRTASHAAG